MFLESHCDEYASLRGRSRREFWHKLFEVWWQRYPWRLPDKEEPPANDPEKMVELSYIGADADEKAAVEARVREVSSSAEIFDLGMIDAISFRRSPRGSATELLLETPAARVARGLRSSSTFTRS